MADVDSRPGSHRSRNTRRQHHDDLPTSRHDRDADDDASASSWQQEVDSICTGTHPQLVAELAKHKKMMQHTIAQAERTRHNQQQNIRNLFECDKKQIEDEHRAQLEFFQNRLIDSLEKKERSAARQNGEVEELSEPADTRNKIGVARSTERFLLKPDELKQDVAELLRNVDRYSVRSAAIAGDELRVSLNSNAGGSNSNNTGASSSNANGDIWFDRNRQLLHFNGQCFERGAPLVLYHNGQRMEEQWMIAAMNAVEVTLRAAEGGKLKVTLSQLRNGRYTFRPA